MIDDSTLAWGKVDTKTGQIEVAKTQTLPGVGPIDNGESLIVPMGAQGSDWYWWAGAARWSHWAHWARWRGRSAPEDRASRDHHRTNCLD